MIASHLGAPKQGPSLGLTTFSSKLYDVDRLRLHGRSGPRMNTSNRKLIFTVILMGPGRELRVDLALLTCTSLPGSGIEGITPKSDGLEQCFPTYGHMANFRWATEILLFLLGYRANIRTTAY